MKLRICIVGYRDWAFDIFRHLQIEDVAKLRSVGVEFDWVTVFSSNLTEYSSFLIENPSSLDAFSMWLTKNNYDLVIFCGWSWIIKDEFVNMHNCLCIHPSDITETRGGTPIQNQILSGRDYTFVTLFKMTEKVDWGPVLDKRKIRLDGYIPEILARITDAAVVSIRAAISALLDGSDISEYNAVLGVPGKLDKRRSPEDSQVKLSTIRDMNFDAIDRLVRSLTGPYPRLCILQGDVNGPVFYVESVIKRSENFSIKTADNDLQHYFVKCKDANVLAIGKYGKINEDRRS